MPNGLRAIALGRKKWLFAECDRGGRTTAILFSLIRSCQRHRIDPFVHLPDVIARISDHPMKRLAELLPDRRQVAEPAAANCISQPCLIRSSRSNHRKSLVAFVIG